MSISYIHNRWRKGAWPSLKHAAKAMQMLEIAHGDTYRDQPVYEIYHDLLQQGTHLGSLGVWYRPLHEGDQIVRISLIASGPLESCSGRNILILKDQATRHLRQGYRS